MCSCARHFTCICFVCLSVVISYLFVRPSVRPSVHSFVRSFVYLFVYLFIYFYLFFQSDVPPGALYTLAYLHSALLQRRKFGQCAFSCPYQWYVQFIVLVALVARLLGFCIRYRMIDTGPGCSKAGAVL